MSLMRLTARKLSACCAVAITTAVSAVAVSPVATAHDTVGGGSWAVSNSSGTCTFFTHGDRSYNICPGQSITLDPGYSYIEVPLAFHRWVMCSTYTPYGELFENEIEDIADLPGRQKYWAENGHGVYVPRASCQLW